MCASSKTVPKVCEGDPIFLGNITETGEPWMVDLDIGHKHIPFKIDTGAEITVMPVDVFKEIFKKDLPALRNATRPLLGQGQIPLDVVKESEKQDFPEMVSTPRSKYGRRIVKPTSVVLWSRPPKPRPSRDQDETKASQDRVKTKTRLALLKFI
ncbi:hypothetical protein DPX16_13506 [Anabarilius grahami]|uniref:Peptidase A2 domain-containing protein n=1 Tax=Anabarilius grahami TaxID=495550 RepID=A0A3N0YBF3_ANAGA|nr:hypothetical protein DPX16_13506 [Anabarilius grahami]